MKQLISILFILFHLIALSQKSNYRLEEYDVKKYTVDLQANPTDSEITVVAKLQILFKSDLETLYLDLHSKEGKNGKGMQILKVVDLKYDDTLNFEHKEDEVRIRSIRFKKDYETTLEVTYSGQPKDGLIISKNKFLHPTIFADNWPNRGHHWLISNDHPSDKALWEVTVTTPAKYKVVSNGSLIYDSVKTDSIQLR
ncbi:MAG: hypothetical protein R2799_12710 [Crocinitomicaceae bacterium]